MKIELTDPARIELINCTLDIMGDKYQDPKAKKMLAAIAWQESNFEHRHQQGGPAHGFWQFESGGGVRGVMNHHSTTEMAQYMAEYFDLPWNRATIYDQIEHNDILACAFARLLLWTIPGSIPSAESAAWDYYIEGWRPGKPHLYRWVKAWEFAGKLFP